MPTWRYSTCKGQTAVGHLWEGCNVKPSADRQIISCCVYVFPSNSDFMACFPMWLALKEKRGTCAREPSVYWLQALPSWRSSLATWGTEARVCSLTHPTFSITVLANHLCLCIYKPPLQIQWAWLVLDNGLWKKTHVNPAEAVHCRCVSSIWALLHQLGRMEASSTHTEKFFFA